jgi:hypothetical protein
MRDRKELLLGRSGSSKATIASEIQLWKSAESRSCFIEIIPFVCLICLVGSAGDLPYYHNSTANYNPSSALSQRLQPLAPSPFRQLDEHGQRSINLLTHTDPLSFADIFQVSFIGPLSTTHRSSRNCSRIYETSNIVELSSFKYSPCFLPSTLW